MFEINRVGLNPSKVCVQMQLQRDHNLKLHFVFATFLTENEAEGHFSMIANCLFRLVELLLEEQSNTSTAPGGENLLCTHQVISIDIDNLYKIIIS